MRQRGGYPADDPAPTASLAEEQAEAIVARASSTADSIAAALERRIVDGGLTVGQRLPTERELAATFSTSRGTVREALRSLETQGLVARRVGSGTFVAFEPDAGEDDDVAEITSPLELAEVRAAIEPHIVRLAVRNATARDIAALERETREMATAIYDPARFSKHDERFHLGLARATRNPLMIEICRRVNHVRTHDQWSTIRDKILTPERIAEYNTQHEALLAALARRDTARAIEIITDHVDFVRSDLLTTER